jgi:hypothetical protein
MTPMSIHLHLRKNTRGEDSFSPGTLRCIALQVQRKIVKKQLYNRLIVLRLLSLCIQPTVDTDVALCPVCAAATRGKREDETVRESKRENIVS